MAASFIFQLAASFILESHSKSCLGEISDQPLGYARLVIPRPAGFALFPGSQRPLLSLCVVFSSSITFYSAFHSCEFSPLNHSPDPSGRKIDPPEFCLSLSAVLQSCTHLVNLYVCRYRYRGTFRIGCFVAVTGTERGI